MRRASYILSGALVALLASTVTVIPQAQAGMRRCDQNLLYGFDGHYAKQATTRAFGKHIPDWSTFNACTNRRSAWSWTQMKRESQADGSSLGGTAFCGRGTGPWTCEFTMNRSLLTSVTVDGAIRRIYVWAPLDLSAPNIARMLQQSIEDAIDIRTRKSCGGTRWRDDDEALAERDSFAAAFRFTQADMFGEIQNDEHGLAVVVDDHLLVYAKPVDDQSPLQFVCWAEQITVA